MRLCRIRMTDIFSVFSVFWEKVLTNTFLFDKIYQSNIGSISSVG